MECGVECGVVWSECVCVWGGWVSDLKILIFSGTDIECSEFYVLFCASNGNSKYQVVFLKMDDIMRAGRRYFGGQI